MEVIPLQMAGIIPGVIVGNGFCVMARPVDVVGQLLLFVTVRV